MTFDFLAMKTTSTTERRAEKERLKEEERAKAQAIEQVCVVFSPVSLQFVMTKSPRGVLFHCQPAEDEESHLVSLINTV